MFSRIICTLSLLLFGVSYSFAQIMATETADSSLKESKSTTVLPVSDSTKPLLLIAEPFVTPKKKAMFSAMVPGLGQIYNKQYWKLPIIYGGLGVAGYFIVFNTDKYNYYRRIYAGRLSNNPEYLNMEVKVSTENIKRLQDSYRSDRDLTVMLTVVGYGLQIMDALVFAHLKGFDISDDISMKVGPKAIQSIGTKPTMGVGLVFNFK